jgi:hypothetical protein
MIEDIQKLVYELDEQVTNEALDDMELTDLARQMLQFRDLVRVVRDLAGRLEQGVARAMPDKKVTIDGLGTLERNVDVSRKNWDHDMVASKLVTQALERWMQETGEVINVEQAQAVLVAIMTACRPEWRMGGLKDYGIDPDDYCEKTYGQPRIRVYAPE